MKKIIGVMGGSKCSEKETKIAYEIGKIVGKMSEVLLTGGMTGVMEAASRGAHEENGLVLAICPTHKREDLNKFVDIGILSGMLGGRNYMNIRTSDIVVAVGSQSAGTLSEIAFAIQMDKPLIIVGASKKMKDYLKDFKTKNTFFLSTSKAVETKLASLIKNLSRL